MIKKSLKQFSIITLIGGLLTFLTSCDNSTNTVTDVDGNVYRTVKIGDQTWMTENLKVSRYRNGDAIAIIADDQKWSEQSTGAMCFYNNDSTTSNQYGGLYNWYAVTDSRNIAPEGWHMPTEEEISKMINFLGGPDLAGSKLKETGTINWLFPNTGATNESVFTALPGGYRFGTGSFHTRGSNAYWWSASMSYELYSWSTRLYYGFADIGRDSNYKTYGFAVRCIKD